MGHWSKALQIVHIALLPFLSLFIHLLTLIINFTLGWTLNPYSEISYTVCNVMDLIVVIALIIYAITNNQYVFISGSYLVCFGLCYNFFMLLKSIRQSVTILVAAIGFIIFVLLAVTTGNLILELLTRKSKEQRQGAQS